LATTVCNIYIIIYNNVASARQGLIDLIPKYSKNRNIVLKCNLFLWSKLNFQHHYWIFSFQCHVVFQKSFLN